jgi:hypothetical protein
MSQLFDMCQAIVNYPKNEMTVDDVIESMNGAAINPHSIRCALSKIASQSILVEPISKHRGRARVYKKRKDIDNQWDWMMAHKSPTDRLVLPYLGAQVPSRKQTVREAAEKKNPNKPAGSRQTEMVAAERIFKELAKIGKALGAIENAIRENTQALQAMEFGKPTVVIRKERT